MKQILLALFVLCTTLTAAYGQPKMFVNAATVNMRETPSSQASIVLKLHAPAAVTVFDPPLTAKYADNQAVLNEWVQVSYSLDSYSTEVKMWTGWISKKYLIAERDSVKVQVLGPLVTFMPGDPLWPSEVVVSGNNSASIYGKGKSKSARVTSRKPASGHQYQSGPRGGCFYYNSSGNKVYVDRSLCN
jgi:hypothetical protein